MRMQRAAVGLGLTSALVLGPVGLAAGFAAATPAVTPAAPVEAQGDSDGLLGGVLDLRDEDTDVEERFGTDDDSDGAEVLEVGDISVILEGVEVLGLDLGSDRRDRDGDGVLEVLLERVLGGVLDVTDDDEDIEDSVLGDGLLGGLLGGD